jgi:hypothetical protein
MKLIIRTSDNLFGKSYYWHAFPFPILRPALVRLKTSEVMASVGGVPGRSRPLAFVVCKVCVMASEFYCFRSSGWNFNIKQVARLTTKWNVDAEILQNLNQPTSQNFHTLVHSYWAYFGLYPSSGMSKISPIALYNIHHRQNPFKSIFLTLVSREISLLN